MPADETQELLEKMLAELYQQQARGTAAQAQGDSYLKAGDGQYLGRVTANQYDNLSLLNEYGPHGSRYSPTSIFNQYCPYGGAYGPWSPENIYCQSPPQLFVNGKLLGRVTDNRYISDRIPFEAFLYSLKNNIVRLLQGRITKSEIEARAAVRQTFLQAADGVFLGLLSRNRYNNESILNKNGPYGSKYSQTSIFNNYSKYGGKFSQLSPFNKFSQTPPLVYREGRHIGYLTVNKYKPNRIDPETLEEWIRLNGQL